MTKPLLGAPAERHVKGARAAWLFGFLAIALQRFGVVAGDGTIQATTVVLILLMLWAVLVTRIKIGTSGALLYAALLISAMTSAVLHVGSSVTSLVLFLATYSVALLNVRDSRHFGRVFFSGAVGAIKVGAILALCQFGWQAIGRGYLDPFLILPESLVRTGFNSYYGIASGTIKPNGMIFLEPSFLSLYTSIAIVYTLTMIFGPAQRRTVSDFVWLAVFSGAFAVSASASGLPILALGLVPLLFRMRRNLLTLAVAGVAAAVAFQFGVFDAVILKANEGWTGNSSTALRLTYPYEYLIPVWLEQPLLGHGPGYATRIIDEIGLTGLQASTLMKMLTEYGLIGAILIGLIAVRAASGRRPAPIVAAILAAWLIPGEALVNGSIVLLLLFGIGQWREETATPAAGAPRALAQC